MNYDNPIMVGLNDFCEWILKIAYISVLWLVFTILGLGIFGIMPATSALFAIARKWIRKEEISKVYKVYWQYYKKDFKTVNILGGIFFVIGTILVLNLRILFLDLTLISKIVLAVTFVIGLLYLFILANFFPVYAHYDLQLFDYLKQTLMVAIAQPIRTIIMLMWTMLILLVSFIFLQIAPFFTIGLIGVGTSWIANRGFFKLQNMFGIEAK